MIYWIYLRSKAGSSVLLKVFQSARRLSDWPPDCLKGCRLCWVSDLKSSDTDCVTRKTLPGNTLAVSISQVNKLELLYYLTVAQLNGRSPCWSKSVTSPHTPLRVTGPFWPDTHTQTHKHTPRLACANIHLVQVMSPSRNVHLAAQKYTKMQSMQSLLAHTHTHSLYCIQYCKMPIYYACRETCTVSVLSRTPFVKDPLPLYLTWAHCFSFNICYFSLIYFLIY